MNTIGLVKPTCTRVASKRLRMRGWLYQRLYKELAWGYDAASWMVSLGQWQAWRRVALEYVAGQRVVEIGFGTGELLLELAARGVQVCGIDLSPEMHRVTAAKLQRRGRRAPLQVQPGLVRAAIQHLPLASGSVDTLITTFPAEFIVQARTWQELGRVLRPPTPGQEMGGRCVAVGISVYLDRGPLRWTSRLTRPRHRSDGGVDAVTRCVRLAGVARLQTRVDMHVFGSSRVPVLVAERVLP